MQRYNINRETCRRRYERTCPHRSVHQDTSYDTWTDCRPTSSGKSPTLTGKVLSSIRCRRRHCYNTQPSKLTVTDVYYMPMNFKNHSQLKVKFMKQIPFVK